MGIYTSYYTKMSRLASDDKLFLQVSLSKPQWFKHKTIPCSGFYPKWDIIDKSKAGKITEAEYKNLYLAMLNKDPEFKKLMRARLRTLQEKFPDKDIFILCWEAPDKFCHRHILADWLDMGIEEYEPKS